MILQSIVSLEYSAQGSDLTPFFGDLSQASEKLSEIKPPLVCDPFQDMCAWMIFGPRLENCLA
jgi:hypothetical protein